MARPWFLAYLSLQIFVLLCLLSTIASSAYYSIRKKFTFAILEPVLDRIEASDRLAQVTEEASLRNDLRAVHR